MHTERSDCEQQLVRREWEAPQVTDIDGEVAGGACTFAVETGVTIAYAPS